MARTRRKAGKRRPAASKGAVKRRAAGRKPRRAARSASEEPLRTCPECGSARILRSSSGDRVICQDCSCISFV